MSKRFLFLLLIPFALPGPVQAGTGDGDYAVTRIPAAMLKNANVVKRMEEVTFSILESNKAVLKRKVAYTILNEQGDRWAYFSEGYDKLRSVESIEGTLYDAMGIKIKSLKKSDIKDESGSDDASLAEDNRIKWHSFFYKVYPYTVEYESEVRFKGTMFLPRWIPQERPVMSVQQSLLRVVCPGLNPLRYKVYNYNEEPVITVEKGDKIYQWQRKDMEAVEYEEFSPPWHELTTSVFMATDQFVLGDYVGSNASWKDFGKFVYALKKDRDALPDAIRNKVHELTDGVTDVNEKIRKLYSFMQENTRYISIQLGVGGWQPFDATYVSTKRYGDCKALSNYMYSLLKEAGIRSVYTVTHRGDDEEDYLLRDLPSSQFNHVVLLVPRDKDTTWLECTSQTYMPGYVGGDNCNRLALAVDETGGTLVNTPRYTYKDNLQDRKITAGIDENGNLEAMISTGYRAVQQDGLHEIINGLSKDKLMELLKKEIDLATYDVKNYKYEEEKKGLPVVNEKLDLVVDNYASVSGKRLFIIPNIISRVRNKLKADESRKNDILIGYPYTDVDSAEISLPAGYMAEFMPQDVKIEARFGKYFSSVKLVDNKLFYYRHYEHYSGRFPASDYPELVKFYDAVYKADRNRVVLVKNQ